MGAVSYLPNHTYLEITVDNVAAALVLFLFIGAFLVDRRIVYDALQTQLDDIGELRRVCAAFL